MENQSLAVMALTVKGAMLAHMITQVVDGSSCFVPERFSSLSEFSNHQRVNFFNNFHGTFSKVWESFNVIVCIMATGIVVRSLAPLVRSKYTDPAIIVIDEAGRHVISLLSGHSGGANEWTRLLSDLIGADPVITTASDVEGKIALDILAKERGLILEGRGLLPKVMGRLLDGSPLWIFDPDNCVYPELYQEYPNLVLCSSVGYNKNYYGIWVSETVPPKGCRCVALHPCNLIVGIGCNKGTESKEIILSVEEVFSTAQLYLDSIMYFASVDVKSGEPGLHEAARYFGREIVFHNRNKLREIEVPNPSSTVEQYIGAASVCEASVLASHAQVQLIVPKTKRGNVTVAVGRVSCTL